MNPLPPPHSLCLVYVGPTGEPIPCPANLTTVEDLQRWALATYLPTRLQGPTDGLSYSRDMLFFTDSQGCAVAHHALSSIPRLYFFGPVGATPPSPGTTHYGTTGHERRHSSDVLDVAASLEALYDVPGPSGTTDTRTAYEGLAARSMAQHGAFLALHAALAPWMAQLEASHGCYHQTVAAIKGDMEALLLKYKAAKERVHATKLVGHGRKDGRATLGAFMPPTMDDYVGKCDIHWQKTKHKTVEHGAVMKDLTAAVADFGNASMASCDTESELSEGNVITAAMVKRLHGVVMGGVLTLRRRYRQLTQHYATIERVRSRIDAYDSKARRVDAQGVLQLQMVVHMPEAYHFCVLEAMRRVLFNTRLAMRLEALRVEMRKRIGRERAFRARVFEQYQRYLPKQAMDGLVNSISDVEIRHDVDPIEYGLERVVGGGGFTDLGPAPPVLELGTPPEELLRLQREWERHQFQVLEMVAPDPDPDSGHATHSEEQYVRLVTELRGLAAEAQDREEYDRCMALVTTDDMKSYVGHYLLVAKGRAADPEGCASYVTVVKSGTDQLKLDADCRFKIRVEGAPNVILVHVVAEERLNRQLVSVTCRIIRPSGNKKI